MEPIVLAAVITATGTVVGATGGAVLGRSDFIDQLFQKGGFIDITGIWRSIWQDLDDLGGPRHEEVLEITRQRGPRIKGHITMEAEPGKKWDFDGNFNGRFLQLFYYPSKKTRFVDYGCYFFQIRGDGNFEGASIGFWSESRIGLSKHCLVQPGSNVSVQNVLNELSFRGIVEPH